MLLDAVLDFALTIAQKIGAQLASLVPPVPSWVNDAASMIATVMSYAFALGNWVPLPIFGVVVVSVVACFVAGVAIKLARIAASFATLGGGGAG